MKPFWKSRTVWFNAAAAAVMIAEAVADILPETWKPYATAFYAVGNILLRFDTKTPVSLGRPK